MGTPAAPHTPPAPAPAAAPPGMVRARWLYVDDARTHEVHAGLRPGPKPAFVVKESAYGADDPSEFVTLELPLEAPWEAQLHHWQLESRLSALGKYWKHDANEPGWRALLRPQGAPDLDMREVGVSPYRGRVVLHHFHNPKLKEDALVVAVPIADARGRRWMLARATFAWPNGADADIALLHPHLPDAPARSILAREHLAMRERKMEKIVWAHDYLRVHGAAWSQEAGTAFADILQRISEGRFGTPQAQRAPVEDPLYTDFLGVLTDPRLLELQSRYLTPEEEAAAFAEGAIGIEKLIASKRQAAPASEQHKLTMLEASLLARHQLRPGQRARVDPEVAALVRRFAYYF